jgi:hypothetical protein
MTDLTVLTDQELAILQKDIAKEVQRRMLPAQMDAMNKTYLTSSGVVPGSAWRQPTGAHDAYPLGFSVIHNEKTWESLTPSNVWEPGVSGWREIVSGFYPAWTQPTGAHDSYALGTQVSHNGQNWTSDVSANVWEPGVYGWTAF